MYINIEESSLPLCLLLKSRSIALLPITNAVTKSEEKLAAAFTVKFCWPWEPKIAKQLRFFLIFLKLFKVTLTFYSANTTLGRRYKGFRFSFMLEISHK